MEHGSRSSQLLVMPVIPKMMAQLAITGIFMSRYFSITTFCSTPMCRFLVLISSISPLISAYSIHKKKARFCQKAYTICPRYRFHQSLNLWGTSNGEMWTHKLLWDIQIFTRTALLERQYSAIPGSHMDIRRAMSMGSTQLATDNSMLYLTIRHTTYSQLTRLCLYFRDQMPSSHILTGIFKSWALDLNIIINCSCFRDASHQQKGKWAFRSPLLRPILARSRLVARRLAYSQVRCPHSQRDTIHAHKSIFKESIQ